MARCSGWWRLRTTLERPRTSSFVSKTSRPQTFRASPRRTTRKIEGLEEVSFVDPPSSAPYHPSSLSSSAGGNLVPVAVMGVCGPKRRPKSCRASSKSGSTPGKGPSCCPSRQGRRVGLQQERWRWWWRRRWWGAGDVLIGSCEVPVAAALCKTGQWDSSGWAFCSSSGGSRGSGSGRMVGSVRLESIPHAREVDDGKTRRSVGGGGRGGGEAAAPATEQGHEFFRRRGPGDNASRRAAGGRGAREGKEGGREEKPQEERGAAPRPLRSGVV